MSRTNLLTIRNLDIPKCVYRSFKVRGYVCCSFGELLHQNLCGCSFISDHSENWHLQSCLRKSLLFSRMPAVMKLEPGEYAVFLGKSSKQPFCDGSHQGTNFVPQKVEITEPKMWRFATVSTQQMVHFAMVHTRLYLPSNILGALIYFY